MNAAQATPSAADVGRWFVDKCRARLADSGDVQTVARQLRKQGVPVDIAVAALAITPPFSNQPKGNP